MHRLGHGPKGRNPGKAAPEDHIRLGVVRNQELFNVACENLRSEVCLAGQCCSRIMPNCEDRVVLSGT